MDTLESLRRKIASAGDLRSVVRTMKAMAAANIAQYERAMEALDAYHRNVELGLAQCYRSRSMAPFTGRSDPGPLAAIVFGSDQGLVGRFNDQVVDRAVRVLRQGHGPRAWVVGERAGDLLREQGIEVLDLHPVPISVHDIAPLASELLLEAELAQEQKRSGRVMLVYNRPLAGARYEAVAVQLLPLVDTWSGVAARTPWPTRVIPELVGGEPLSLRGTLHEHLFIAVFRACAASLASENASRLAAMQRADRNIHDLLDQLGSAYQQLRQNTIDEELFDVVAGYTLLRDRH